MAKPRINKRRIKQAPKNCYFCKEKKQPVLSEVDGLRKFLTERGKITPRSRNGLCAKHQKAVTKTVKQGRYLALLSFVVR